MKEDVKLSREDRLIQEIKNTDIREIMEVQPNQIEVTYGNLYGPSTTLQTSLLAEVSYIKKLCKAIQIAACYFVLATEMRMKLADNILPNTNYLQCRRVHSCYHLAAIILTGKYVPYETKFLTHLISSFHKNYQIDLMEACEQIDLSQKEPEANLFMDFIEIETKVEKNIKK